MRRVEAESHASPDPARQGVPQVAQLLEARAQRGSRSRGPLDPHLHLAGNRPQTFRVAGGVALEARLTVVHVVTGVRDDGAQPQRARALQLVSETLDAA